MSEWISVKDRLPEVRERVIVCRKRINQDTRKQELCIESGSLDGYGMWRVFGTRTDKVTHWMPLPEPPEGCNG